MFDILVYLFENYGAFNACADADALTRKLTAAGFAKDEISDALAWLQQLARVSKDASVVGEATPGTFRVYSGFEAERLGSDAIGFLTFLESAGQLSTTQREIVIERALAVADAPVSLDKLKVIVLMVLWCQEADIDVLVLEELLDDGEDRLLH
jgi:Smg protein